MTHRRGGPRKTRARPPALGVLREALSRYQAGDLAEAERICAGILAAEPDHADTLELLGAIRFERGDPGAAAELIGKAVALRPERGEGHYNLGKVLAAEGKIEEAIAAYRKAVALKPDLAEAHYNLGIACDEKGELVAAVAAYRGALEASPTHASSCNNLAVALQKQGKAAESEAACRRALELRPDFALAHNNLGNALKHQGKLKEAVAAYRGAVEVEPAYAEAHYNLGNALKDLGRPEAGVASLRQAVTFDPELAPAQATLMHALQHLCEWGELERVAARVDGMTEDALAKGLKPAESPFESITRRQDPARNLAIARSWSADTARRVAAFASALPTAPRGSPKARLKLGYLSGNFYSHAMVHLMASMFGLHDRRAFEVRAYSYGPDDASPYRKRIEDDCDAFVELRDLSAADAARRIAADGVDILVDLHGHTSGARLEICALRPAPVQVTYMGFPGSNGADFFDYLLGDRIVSPEDEARYYAEKLVLLPNCYMVNDHRQAISDKTFARADFGLPRDGGIVFCSFNQSYKIEPVMWGAWMRILRSVPGSVLWLLRNNDAAVGNLRREARSRGIDPHRIVFAERLPKPEHLARLALADLFLDTRIYNSHTSASDALWAGVPMITLVGSHFASRVGASLLMAIALPELVTDGLEAYEALAVGLARAPGELSAMREKLWRNRLIEPLFDTPRFVRGLERAYRMMWDRHASAKPPHQLSVPDS